VHVPADTCENEPGGSDCNFCNPLKGFCEPITDPEIPPICLPADEICRTPGYWKTHAGNEKGRPPGNVTQAVIDGAGGSLDVCGFQITNTEVFDPDNLADVQWKESALEAMCVSVKGIQQRQLIRQLTAAQLNCAISGGWLGSCNEAHQKLISDCNVICAADAGGMNDCISAIDAFNNGFDSGGTCDDGSTCTSDDECDFIGGGKCTPDPDNCHERSLCPDLDDDGDINGSDYCFRGGPAGSTGACKSAHKNGVYLPASP